MKLTGICSRSVFAEHPWLTLAPALRWAVHRHLSLDAMYRTGAEAEHLRHTQNARAFAQLALCFAFDLAVYLWPAKPFARATALLSPARTLWRIIERSNFGERACKPISAIYADKAIRLFQTPASNSDKAICRLNAPSKSIETVPKICIVGTVDRL